MIFKIVSIHRLIIPRFAIFYVCSAVVTLFSNIVIFPIRSESVDDIMLIQRTANYIEGHAEWCESYQNAASIDMIRPFIQKLGQVATAAVIRTSPEMWSSFQPFGS